jgi:ATP-binding cassette, subfamily B, bacterial MsbA
VLSEDSHPQGTPVANNSGLNTLLGYAKPHWRVAIGAGAGIALEAGVAAAFTYLMKYMLDDVFKAHDQTVAFWLPWIILALFALRAVGVYVGDLGTAKIARSIVRDTRALCFERYLRLPTSFFASHDPGPLTSRLTNEVEQLGQACTESFKIILADGLMIVGLFAVMLATSVKLTLTVLIAGPLIGFVVSRVAKRYRRLSLGIQDSLGAVTSRTQTVIAGERDVKLYGAQSHEEAVFAAINQHNFRSQMKIAATNALSTSLVQFLAAGALALVIYVAAHQARAPGVGGMSPGEFMSFITSMLLILPSLKRLTNVQNLIGRGVAAAASVATLLREPIETDAGVLALERTRGQVQFKHVSLRYPGANVDALTDIDLTLAPGTVTALVGRSGGGKTSIAQVLARLITPSAGAVLLDGVAIERYTLSSYRQQIGWVGQAVVLNGETVRDNVAYGGTCHEIGPEIDAGIWRALADAQAAEFVQALAQGIDTELGSNGALLSGGQRQRIALARAIYKRGKFLLLDEATSALDNAAERAVQTALAQLRAQTTTLVIAHRLSTIEHADQIVVLDQGRIVERGTHAELMALRGIYLQLHSAGFAE